MHTPSLEPWQHHHALIGAKHDQHERQTWIVFGVTSVIMESRLLLGRVFGSLKVPCPSLVAYKGAEVIRCCPTTEAPLPRAALRGGGG